jgi:hypothetical protein
MSENKLQAMMAQLKGTLDKGKEKPKPRVVAEPKVEEPQKEEKRGVGPTPGKVKGIDDVETREGTVSEIADLANQAAEKTGVADVAESEKVSGPLEDDPELAELLAPLDSGSADLDADAAVEALVEKPADPMEAATKEVVVTRPAEEAELDARVEGVEKAIEDALAEPEETVSGADVESVPPSSMEALESEAEESQERETAASVSAVAAQVLEQVNAAIDEKLAPLKKQLKDLKASVDETVEDVNARMGRLAESTVGMDTFNSFFMEDFAPVLEAVEKVEAMEGQVSSLEGQVAGVEETLKGVTTELSSDEGAVSKLAGELDALKSKVENETVSSEMWNTFLEEEYLPVAELRDQLEELNLPELAKAMQELSVKWEELAGTGGERVAGMVHAHREASVVVAVEILRNTTEDNFHRLQDFVSDYGQEWVKDVMRYLAENPEVIRDKVALAKYNVMYSHMANSQKLQSHKEGVDAEVQRVIGFANQLTGDS